MDYPIQSRLSKFFDTKLAIILVLLAVIFICSCTPKYTEQAAIEGVNKANDNYPKPVADWLRGKYPCITIGTKSDSTEYKHWQTQADSLRALYEEEKNKLPEIVHITDTVDCVAECNKRIDELNKSIWLKDDYIRKLQDKIKQPKAIHDTTKIEDSAKIKSMAEIINTLSKKSDEQQAKIETLKQDLDTMKGKRDYWRIRFFILAGIFGAAIFLRIKRIL